MIYTEEQYNDVLRATAAEIVEVRNGVVPVTAADASLQGAVGAGTYFSGLEQATPPGAPRQMDFGYTRKIMDQERRA